MSERYNVLSKLQENDTKHFVQIQRVFKGKEKKYFNVILGYSIFLEARIKRRKLIMIVHAYFNQVDTKRKSEASFMVALSSSCLELQGNVPCLIFKTSL